MLAEAREDLLREELEGGQALWAIENALAEEEEDLAEGHAAGPAERRLHSSNSSRFMRSPSDFRFQGPVALTPGTAASFSNERAW
jgi:hypothetical protein